MIKIGKNRKGWGNSLSYLLVGLLVFGAAMSALAEGAGPNGFPNLLENPAFQNATIPSGNFGRYIDATLPTIPGWSGCGKAGVAKKADTTWLPRTSRDYRAFIQNNGTLNDDDSCWLEQTVTVEESGSYVFSCKYVTRSGNYSNDGQLGFSITLNGVSAEYEPANFRKNDTTWHTAEWRFTLAAGQTCTFRIHGVHSSVNPDRTVIIDSCALERVGVATEGYFGQLNLLVNPAFEDATIPSGSNNGNWGRYLDATAPTLVGWIGHGKAGVAKNTDDTTWLPWGSDKDEYRAFIHNTSGGYDADDSSWLEQTVRPLIGGTYAFTCRYATRTTSNGASAGTGSFGLNIVCDGATNECDAVTFSATNIRHLNTTWYFTIEAGRVYTFRLHGIGGLATDRCVMIDYCSLERLPSADRTINGEYHLVANEDWSAETVDITSGAEVHLDGHTLKIGDVRPNARGVAPVFTDETVSPGELCVVVPEGEELANNGWSVAGGVMLVKDGPGTFIWNGGTVAETAPILITNGVFRLGTSQANLFGESGTATVRCKGQFDLHWSYAKNMQSAVYGRTFNIEGDGPDGSGAIVNTVGSPLDYSYGCHFSHVVLGSDATVGGNARIDFRGNGDGIDGVGRILTVKNTHELCFTTDSHLACADVIVTGDGMLEACNNCMMDISGSVRLHGGRLNFYVANNSASNQGNNTYRFLAPVVVGEGGGHIGSSLRYFHLDSPLTVESGNTLTCEPNGWSYKGTITNETGATINVTGWVDARIGVWNDGLIDHTADKLYFGHHSETESCAVQNNGTIRTSGGEFCFKAESTMTGTGTLEVLGGSPVLAGDFTGYEGTILLDGGTTSIGQPATFGGTLVLRNGALSSGTSLAAFPGTAVIDVAAQTGTFNVDGKNWLTFSAGKEVFVDVGSRELQYGDRIISWTDAPLDVRFKFFGNHSGELRKDGEGVVYTKRRGTMLIIR
ncbi:MAG: hypothetical protein IJG18_02170 [Kiritimatiellae bacterium]|nr:hypothetical protein [Kiritimatiellia bacterium]